VQQVARPLAGAGTLSVLALVWPCRKRSNPAPSSRITAAACPSGQGQRRWPLPGSLRRESPGLGCSGRAVRQSQRGR